MGDKMEFGESEAAQRRSMLPLVFGFLLLVSAVAASIWFTAQQQRTYTQISHTLIVENAVSQVLMDVRDAESGGRGFLLTGRSDFLQPVDEAVRALPANFARLRDLVADNPGQQANVDRLRAVAAERMRYVRLSIQNYWRGVANPPENFLRGQALMGQFQDIAEELKAEEDRLLALRTGEADRQARWASAALAASALLVIILFLAAIRNNRRRLADALGAHNALAEANRLLVAEAESREVAEAQVRQMHKVEAIGQLTGGIAHDFNNMLAVVIGSLDLAQQRLDKGETPRAARLIGNAMEGAQRAAQLTARLLAFSRQQPLDPQALDVNKLVGGMSEIVRRTIGDEVRMETVLAGGLWRTFADPGQLENAIVNLCINGRDAMAGGGKLTLETANCHLDDDYVASHPEVAAGQYVMVSVADTGAGMTPEVVERAFDPFFTTKGAGKGTGLGLSQVHGFIKQSGGHLKIYSETGHGTIVKLYLPRHAGAVADAEPATRQDDSLGTMPRARGEIVLVVEDDERVRHVSVDALRGLGYTVVQASDGNQGLAALAIQPRIDLLFTDVVMPDLNGRQLANKARAARPDLKVLFTTGYTRNAIVHNGTLDADVDFLPKPFTVEQLARKVRWVLDQAEPEPVAETAPSQPVLPSDAPAAMRPSPEQG